MNTREKIAVVLRDVKNLPTLPDVAVKLLEMGESPTSSVRDLAQWIERDAALATRVLKLVNSSFFGVQHEVTSIRHALMILGMAHLRNLVLSSAVSNLFDRDGCVGSFNRKEFWRHCVATAGAARTIAARTNIIDPETAFTAGLIHDVGKLVLDRYLHEDFVKVIQTLDAKGGTMKDAELETLGTTHAEIGRHLAVHWNLPEVLRVAVGFHHEPESAPSRSDIAALIAVADAMVRELRVGSGGGEDQAVDEKLLSACKVSSELYDTIKKDLSVDLEEQVGVLAESE
ncbi:HDOD domain-containing protein [candidate division KSB1 bacterium]|nr:MAG: HDOD domain-containing protein [candidate division KSB1 bacterium]